MTPLTVGSLFSGIGGFEFGLERTGGFKTVWQCEIDPFCLKVLAKHWPDVKRFADIKKMGIGEEIPYVDVICGGFPCQPVSCAGKRKGKEDTRWLWPEFCRVVRSVRPEWVLIENVPGLLSADSGRLFAGILRDLSESGYDAEWNIVSAASVGAPHLRKRVFIVAKMVHPLHGGYIHQESSTSPLQDSDRQENRLSGEASPDVADADQIRRRGRAGMFWQGRGRESQDGGAELPDPKGALSGHGNYDDVSLFGNGAKDRQRASTIRSCDWWAVEPGVGGTLDGFSKGLHIDRLISNQVHECTYDGKKTHAGKVLPALWKEDGSKADGKSLRIDERVQEKKVLLHPVLWRLDDSSCRDDHKTRCSEESTESHRNETMPEMRANESEIEPTPRRSPEGIGCDGSLHRMPCNSRPEVGKPSDKENLDLCDMWWRVSSEGFSSTQNLFRKMLLGTGKEKRKQAMENPWADGWEDGVPRIATGVKNRVDRLRALGNAIVPQCAQFVGQCLLDSIRTEAAQ